MTASYSTSLLEAWNLNLSAYSMSIPSGEVRINPTSLPCAFDAPSDVELAQLYGPLHQSSGGLRLM